jgi:hypothetical protein
MVCLLLAEAFRSRRGLLGVGPNASRYSNLMLVSRAGQPRAFVIHSAPIPLADLAVLEKVIKFCPK